MIRRQTCEIQLAWLASEVLAEHFLEIRADEAGIDGFGDDELGGEGFGEGLEGEAW